MKLVYALLIVLIVGILLVGGYFLFSGSLNSSDYDEYCYIEHPEKCYRECYSDDDCILGDCYYIQEGLGINKKQKFSNLCNPDTEDCPLCGVFEAVCIDNICEIKPGLL